MENTDIPYIEKAFVVSTSHIKKETDSFLQTTDQLIVYPKEGGYFVYINSIMNAQEIPEELLGLISKAEKLECCWLILDNAAKIYEGLPTFNW